MGADHSNRVDPDRWVELYADYLYRFAIVRVRDHHTARDLVQDTLLAGLKARDRYQGAAAERTWLTGILKNKIVDYYRRGRREALLGDLVDDTADSPLAFNERGHWQSGPTTPKEWSEEQVAHMDRPEFWRRFEDCAEKLPEQTRRAFVMREVDGLETEEICAALSISPQNFWTIMHRARASLRRCLEVHWFAVAG
ncbi:MAG TPA: sigma-70 family RNA polymerase sigma factor [Kiritimatiellia bacterium]|nr:sigma-70 family RNA polymerase sigma factor [Kiritimatiellia bacterium]